MASHVFNVIAGGKYPKQAGGLTSGNVVTDYLRETGGYSVTNRINVLSNAPGGTDAENDFQLIFGATASTATIKAQDNAQGTGDFVTITATATGPSGTLDYEGATGLYGSEVYVNGTTEWFEEWDSPDGEGFYDTYLTVKYNGVTVYNRTYGIGATTVGNYQKGSLQSSSGSIMGNGPGSRDYAVKELDPALTVFYKTGVTLTDYKVVWTTTGFTNAAGETVPLRNLNGSPLASSGDTDSGWIAHGAADIELDIQQISDRSPATTPFSGLVHSTTGTIKFYTRNGSGDSGTLHKTFTVWVNNISESS
jgi:hypothetical protein